MRMAETVALTQHRITVLLIDDQPMIGEAVRRMLAGEQDIDFYHCADPSQAIKMAQEIAPTVILQDLVMPEIDGLLLARYFRANAATRDIPLIVLSSKEDPVIKAEAFALGANDYMVKLPDRLEVLARIRYHSRGYIIFLERNEAYQALLESQKQLEIRNRFIRETFGRYVSDEIVETILETPEGLKIGGEKRLLTIMMTDLRGFTSVCERLSAEEVVHLLNVYLETMTEIILKYQGTIIEFIGDAILVVFGAPFSAANDAQRAVACALDMQLAMTKLCDEKHPELCLGVKMGIGINTGDVIVGNIGSSKRTKYDVIGHHVNLASRIESFTIGGQVFASESTVQACGALLRLDDQLEVTAKGIKEPIAIYEIGGIGGDFGIFLPEKQASELQILTPPLLVQLSMLEGKHTGENVYSGQIGKLAHDAAEITAERTFRQLTDLKLSLPVEQNGVTSLATLYAKVTAQIADTPPVFRVNFTSLPPEAERLFRQLLDA